MQPRTTVPNYPRLLGSEVFLQMAVSFGTIDHVLSPSWLRGVLGEVARAAPHLTARQVSDALRHAHGKIASYDLGKVGHVAHWAHRVAVNDLTAYAEAIVAQSQALPYEEPNLTPLPLPRIPQDDPVSLQAAAWYKDPPLPPVPRPPLPPQERRK